MQTSLLRKPAWKRTDAHHGTEHDCSRVVRVEWEREKRREDVSGQGLVALREERVGAVLTREFP